MKKLILLFFTSTLLLSAQITVKKPETVFDKLLGTWQFGANAEYESWTKVNHVYYANVFSVTNGDTTLSEKCKIYKKGGKYYFEQEVVLKNISTIFKFKLIDLDQELMVFENKKQEFPQKVAYEIVLADELAVVQEGIIEGKTQFVNIAYKKVK